MHANRKKKSRKTKAICTENTAQRDNEEPESEESLVERFEKELTWCVEQLQLGLETQNPDSRHATEAVKVLKILTSSKAPMVKKRLAMRNAFGDYRQKIREQEKKSAAAARKMRLLPVEDKGYEKSQFFKKSTKRTASGHLKNTLEPTSATNLKQLSDDATDQKHIDAVPETDRKSKAVEIEIAEVDFDNAKVVDNAQARTDELNRSFKFSFKLDDDVDVAAAGDTGEPEYAGDAAMANAGHTAEEQTFTFSKSDNTFKFSFTVEDEKK